jgi:hypothetical protein
VSAGADVKTGVRNVEVARLTHFESLVKKA